MKLKMYDFLKYLPAIIGFIAGATAIILGSHNFPVRALGTGGLLLSLYFARRARVALALESSNSTGRQTGSKTAPKGGVIAILFIVLTAIGVGSFFFIRYINLQKFDPHLIYLGIGAGG